VFEKLIFSRFEWIKMNTDISSCNAVKYQIESIINGFLAFAGVWLSSDIFFYLIIFNGVFEYAFGFQNSPINILISLFDKVIAKNDLSAGFQVPPKIVLKTNSIFMIMFAVIAIWLIYDDLISYVWLPGSLIGAFSILVGTTGICPVALTYAYYKKIQAQ